MNSVIIIASASISSAVITATVAHYLQIRRWKLERREVYKSELFKTKLKVYSELLTVYFEFCSKYVQGPFSDIGMKEIVQFSRPVHDFVKNNMIIISEPVMELALKKPGDELTDDHTVADIFKITNRQYIALANACRAELGVETISKELKDMFTVMTDKKNVIKNNTKS